MKFTTVDGEDHVIDPESIKRISGGGKSFNGNEILYFWFYGERPKQTYLFTPSSAHHVQYDYENYLKLTRYQKKL